MVAESVFTHKLREAERRADSLACVGLDPDLRRFPPHLATLDPREAIVRFNAAIIEATHDLVSAYKPNLGFYAAYGIDGIAALIETRGLVPDHIPVILDCKVGDMDNTAAAYAHGYFEEWGFDAVTANPYLGEDSLAPFFNYPGHGVIIICKTSNPGSGDLQDLTVREGDRDEPLYAVVARRAMNWDAAYPAGIGLVVGATYPDQLAAIRQICPDQPILLPGVGAQSGKLTASVKAGVDAQGELLIVSSSRSVIYAGKGKDFASDAREATLRLRDDINGVRQ
jgi:orotidine-5'-phosphate decarboxylase